MPCMNCGKASQQALCDACSQSVDRGELCRKMCEYKTGGGRPAWDALLADEQGKTAFRRSIIEVAAPLPETERLWWELLAIAGNRTIVPTEHRDWLIDLASRLLPDASIPQARKTRIRAFLLGTYQAEYRFAQAEKVVSRMMGQTAQVPQAACALATFLINTRRYEQAREVLREAMLYCDTGPLAFALRQCLADCEARESGLKAPYKPVPKANKETVLADFQAFLHTIGTDTVAPVRQKSRAPAGVLPLYKPGFRSFVAFDLETTGLSPESDNITEIGAVRVVDGVVAEEKRFCFQELVFPHEKPIPPQVEALTGITNAMVANARTIREVYPAFADFVGRDILVGYNCFHFDCKFLTRAARMCGMDLRNVCFDLLPWSKSLVDELHLSPSGGLNALSRDLHIVNPQAHRALADALTTARAYLTLLEMHQP